MSAPVAIHQFLPTLNPGDAIGNVTRAIRDELRALGHPSEIFAENVHDELLGEAHRHSRYPHFEDPRNVVVYHFSVASPLSEFVRLLWERKVLIYHNVTPPHFYDGLEPHVRDVLRRSENELRDLASVTDVAVGDSGFNCAELERVGYRDPIVLPILLSHDNLDVEPDAAVMARPRRGTRVLFVGKIGPNKRFEDLMVCFEHFRRTRDPEATLDLVGGTFSPLYQARLEALRDRLGPDSIRLVGRVTQAELVAYYRSSDVFLCLSDHEGYCVPLVECMHVGLPIVAFRQGGVEWTLGGSGMLLDRKDPESVAAALDRVRADAALREELVAGQRRRLPALAPEAVRARLREVVERALAVPVRKPRVAFVVQRYGAEVSGGSEAHCRAVVRRLAGKADIEVLTTTARDYETWAPHYAAGEGELDGVPVHRYPVLGGRELKAFARASETFFARDDRSVADEASWVHDQGPFAPALSDAVLARRDAVDAFVFFTYLYHPTVKGLLDVGPKSLLVPTVHDEVPFHFRVHRAALKRARGMFFNTEEERALIEGALGGPRGIGITTGVGVNDPGEPSADRFRERTGIDGPFLLYVGRVSPAKGCEQLLELYARLRREMTEPPALVLMGRPEIDLPEMEGLHALGFVEDESEKFDAMAACLALVNPSPMESLSMVLLEAWLVGRPTIANAASPALVGQSRRSGAGLWYRSPEEFVAIAERLAADPELCERMGRGGQRYVRSRYHWDVIVHKYLVGLRYLYLHPELPEDAPA